MQPNGTVVVPTSRRVKSGPSRSTNGGAHWDLAYLVANVSAHTVAGNLRTSPLPSAEVDGAGRVYVVWQDCRFRAGCSSNDVVMSTSTDGTAWSALQRIPIDPVTSTADHFIPGLAVDRTTSGGSAQLALTYYFYPTPTCTVATCQLSSASSRPDGGANWSAPTTCRRPRWR